MCKSNSLWIALSEFALAGFSLEFPYGWVSPHRKRSFEMAKAREAAAYDFASHWHPYVHCGWRGECCRTGIPARLQHLSDILFQPAAMAAIFLGPQPMRGDERIAQEV